MLKKLLNKRLVKLILPLFLMTYFAVIPQKSPVTTSAWSGTQTSTAGSYYSSVGSETGTALKSKLKTIISSPTPDVDYDWSRFQAADEAEGDSNSVLLIYSRVVDPKSNTGGNVTNWNREHTYPQSKIDSTAAKDNHHIFADDNKTNGARGNKLFGVVTESSGNRVKDMYGKNTDNYTTSDYFMPNPAARGEVARATMYVDTLYDYSVTGNFQSVALMLQWHLENPVTNREIYRNNTVHTLQKNRNPYIDHPEYACAVYGDTNSETQSLCATQSTVEVTDVNVSPTLETINLLSQVNGVQLNAEILPTNASNKNLTWSSSNNAVASVSASGYVTGLSVGSAIITATSVSNPSKKALAAIEVVQTATPVSSVSLNKSTTSLELGKTETLIATVLPANATNKNVLWTSQNNNVVTVNNGVLTAVGVGTTTVTVTTVDGGKTASISVSVYANSVIDLIVNHTNVKKTYSLGETFEGFSGLVVKEKRANGEETIINDYSISTINTMELGKQIVRVEKGEFSDQFVINVTNEGASVGSISTPAVTYTETFTKDSKGVVTQTGQSYGDGTFIGAGGVLFTYVHSQEPSGADVNYAIDGHGILLRRANEPSSLTFTLPDGLNSLSFDYKKAYTGNSMRNLSVKIGNLEEITISPFNDSNLHKFEINNLSLSTATTVILKLIGANGNQHVSIDNVSWTTNGSLVDGLTYEEQARAFARFVSRALPMGSGGRFLPKSLGPATQVAPSWEEVEAEKDKMAPESLVVFQSSNDPEITASRELYEVLEENSTLYAAALVFNDYIMGLTSEGDVTTEDCLANFNLAKTEWNKLSEEVRAFFLDSINIDFEEGRSRLLHWAFVNGWELSGVMLQEQGLEGQSTFAREETNNNVIATIIIGVIGLTTLAGYYFLQKKKEA